MAHEHGTPGEYPDSLPVRVDETSALLANVRETDGPLDEPQRRGPADGGDAAGKRRLRVTILIFVLLILTNTFGLLQSSAQVQLFENIYCSEYYTGHPSSKPPTHGGSCKIDTVQANVAFLRGWKSFLDFLPAVILILPYGMLVDRYGRKWMLVMNLTSMSLRYAWVYLVCSFPAQLPIWTVCLQSLFGIFGGGNIVAVSLMFVVLSDVTPPSQTAVVFFRVGAVSFLCFLIGFSIAGALMEMNTWLPFSLAVSLHLLTIPIALALPETLNPVSDREPEIAHPAQSSPLESDGPSESRDPNPIPVPNGKDDSRRGCLELTHQVMSTNFGFLKDWRTLFLTFTFPIREALNSLDDLYFQYIPNRFGWSIAKTNFVYSFQAAAATVILLAICPAVSTYLLQTKGLPPVRKDLLFARYSVLIYALGTLCIAAAPTIPTLLLAILLQTCGSGMGGATRALMTTYVKSDEVGKLYTLLGLVEAVGLMVSAPIEASLFNVGFRAGATVWLGLPWFLMGLCLSLLTVAFWTLRLA